MFEPLLDYLFDVPPIVPLWNNVNKSLKSLIVLVNFSNDFVFDEGSLQLRRPGP